MAYIKSLKGQDWLLPSHIEDLIPGDHICFLVEALVESMDFTSFDIKYSGAGHPAYYPRILLKLLTMGVLDKVRSSRKLARNARENVVYMYLAEKLSPDFRTISDFRKNNPDIMKEAFKHTVKLAKQYGMLDLSCLSTDGTKIKANASNKSMITKEELMVLLKFVDNELEAWANQDKIEDEQFGGYRGSDQLPEKSKKKIQRIVKDYVNKMKRKPKSFKEKTKQKLERVKKEIEENGLKKASLVDAESRFMRNKKKKFELSYNPQLTTDKKGFIIACDVCQDSNDLKQLEPQVNQVEESLGEIPEESKWEFDNGYYSTGNLEVIQSKKIDAYIAVQKRSTSEYSSDKFKYNPEKDEYTCPQGNPVKFLSKRYDKCRRRSYLFYKAQGCRNCPYQHLCTKNKTGERLLKMMPNQQLREAMYTKMQATGAKEIYKLRKQTVEPAIGDIKHNKGLTEFLTKGLKNVRTEMKLVCTASNLKKIWIQMQQKTKQMKTVHKTSPKNLFVVSFFDLGLQFSN